jgi:hypothetical protein
VLDIPDRNMKNEKFCSQLSILYTLKDTWDLGARGLSVCVEDSRRLAVTDEGDPGFQLLTEKEIAAVIHFHLFSKFFLSCLLGLSFAY